MADNRSVTITLRLDENSNQSNVSNQTNTNKVKNDTDNDSQSKAIAAFAVAQLAEMATTEIVGWAEYYWNRELTLNDDYIGQREKNIALTHINSAISRVSNIATATAQGAMIGGPIGAAIGFLIGAGTQAASIARSNAQGQDQQNIQIMQLNAQLDFTRSRAGWSTKAASIGENL